MLPLIIVVLFLPQVYLADSKNDYDKVYKQYFTLDDQIQFADLNVYNFDKEMNYTYQYSPYTYQFAITARPNRQVTIYFLTLASYSTAVLYDGADATAPKVDLSGYNQSSPVGYPMVPYPITSTGRNFYLKVNSTALYGGIVPDFQAIATDLIQPAACGDLIYDNACDYSYPPCPQAYLAGVPEGCIHIFRTVDYRNEKYAMLHITGMDTDATTQLYKGLSMKPEYKFANVYYEYVFNEKNFIIQHQRPMTINYGLQYYKDYNRNQIMTVYNPIGTNQSAMFVTADYLPARPIGEQEYTTNSFQFEPIFDVTSVRINFLTLIPPNGQLFITYMKYKKGNRTDAYYHNYLPKTLIINKTDADQFLMSYSCTGAECTGMYGTVEDATYDQMATTTTPTIPTGKSTTSAGTNPAGNTDVTIPNTINTSTVNSNNNEATTEKAASSLTNLLSLCLFIMFSKL